MAIDGVCMQLESQQGLEQLCLTRLTPYARTLGPPPAADATLPCFLNILLFI